MSTMPNESERTGGVVAASGAGPLPPRTSGPGDETTARLDGDTHRFGTGDPDLPPAPDPARRGEPPAPPPAGRPAPPPPAGRPGAVAADERAAATPRARASLLATLGLVAGTAAALLVLSGPLLGYGIGVAGLGLLLSLLGLRATRHAHVAGKLDALLGLALAAGAAVVGVLALTGRLPWLGTDMQPVDDLRRWLDARTVERF